MGGLVKLLGIERGTNAEGHTGAEQDVVGDSGDTTVVDLDLFRLSVTMARTRALSVV